MNAYTRVGGARAFGDISNGAGCKRDRRAAPLATGPPAGCPGLHPCSDHISYLPNNNTFTWSGPSGALDCTGQRTVGHGIISAE
jgi:hypothetical protein